MQREWVALIVSLERGRNRSGNLAVLGRVNVQHCHRPAVQARRVKSQGSWCHDVNFRGGIHPEDPVKAWRERELIR
jgi:hypothetical protein